MAVPTRKAENNGCVVAILAVSAIIAALTMTTADSKDGYWFALFGVAIAVALHFTLKHIAKRNAEQAARDDMAARAAEYGRENTTAGNRPKPPEPK